MREPRQAAPKILQADIAAEERVGGAGKLRPGWQSSVNCGLSPQSGFLNLCYM